MDGHLQAPAASPTLGCMSREDLKHGLPLWCRSQQESRRSMHVKDAMRELCIREVAEAWFHLVTMYKDSQPELAAMVLESVRRYINWIDINLVANNRCLA